MNVITKTDSVIAITQKQFEILEILARLGPSTSEDVQQHLTGKADLLEVMRRLHIMVDRGLLDKRVTANQRLYVLKRNYKTIRSRMVVVDAN